MKAGADLLDGHHTRAADGAGGRRTTAEGRGRAEGGAGAQRNAGDTPCRCKGQGGGEQEEGEEERQASGAAGGGLERVGQGDAAGSMEGALATPGAWAGAAMAGGFLAEIETTLPWPGGPGERGGYLAEATPSPSGPGGETVDIPCCGTEFIMYLCLCTALVIFAALMAGLTMALMRLTGFSRVTWQVIFAALMAGLTMALTSRSKSSFRVIFAALMAGLTMALMSLDAMNISIIEASGTEHLTN
ncbi:hypothetical protein T484DRAFT_1815415 [Baffinella frigidus]|nr:hypothetical protein T484DRAFT_1815415 [Cryptophyta sp. CCMP2293]